jgi:hypothetical protein
LEHNRYCVMAGLDPAIYRKAATHGCPG